MVDIGIGDSFDSDGLKFAAAVDGDGDGDGDGGDDDAGDDDGGDDDGDGAGHDAHVEGLEVRTSWLSLHLGLAALGVFCAISEFRFSPCAS